VQIQLFFEHIASPCRRSTFVAKILRYRILRKDVDRAAFLCRENKRLKDMQQEHLAENSVPEKSSVSALSALHMGLGANHLCNGIQRKK